MRIIEILLTEIERALFFKKNMDIYMSKNLFLVFLFFSAALISGCVSAPVYHTDPKLSNIPSLYDKARAMKRIAVILPYTYIAEVNAGGVAEERDDWEADAKKKILVKIEEVFKKRGVVSVVIPITDKNKESLREIAGLSQVVIISTVRHTIPVSNDNYFPERAKNFDYSVGAVQNILKEYSADGLLIFSAQANILSSGRRTVGRMVTIPVGYTLLQALVCDPDGQVLWTNYRHWWGLNCDFMETADPNIETTLFSDLRGTPWEK
jgi:hypothetical protein